MIKIEFSKLKNGNLEITEDMLNDTLSYMKRQENYIKQLRQENESLKNGINENVLIFTSYGMRGSGKSFCERLKEKDLEINRLKQDIELLRYDLDQANSTSSKYAKRILNTLNYMNSIVFQWTEFKEIKNKLLGVDKNE